MSEEAKLVLNGLILVVMLGATTIMSMIRAQLKHQQEALNAIIAKQDALAKELGEVRLDLAGEYQTREDHDRICSLPALQGQVARLTARVERYATQMGMMQSRRGDDKEDSQG